MDIKINDWLKDNFYGYWQTVGFCGECVGDSRADGICPQTQFCGVWLLSHRSGCFGLRLFYR